MKRAITAISFALALLLATPTIAQDLQKGYDAAERGDYATAIKEYRPLADAGDSRAQFELGYLYHVGLGVLEDYKEAMKWYRKAASQGHEVAQNNLGYMFEYGQGVLHDYVAAHAWYNIAASNGSDLGRENKDNLVEQIWNGLSSDDITKAQALARKCLESNYQDCP